MVPDARPGQRPARAHVERRGRRTTRSTWWSGSSSRRRQPGRWVVRVRGVDVPWGPQPFALVVRGALTDCPAPAAPGGTRALGTPADHQVQVTWSAVPGAAAYNVYRSLGACPGGSCVPVAAAVTGTTLPRHDGLGRRDLQLRRDGRLRRRSARANRRAPLRRGRPHRRLLPRARLRRHRQRAERRDVGTCTVSLSWSPAHGRTARGTSATTSIGARRPASSPARQPDRPLRWRARRSTTPSASARGTSYWYVVRAEDATTGHGGPCRGGNEEREHGRGSRPRRWACPRSGRGRTTPATPGSPSSAPFRPGPWPAPRAARAPASTRPRASRAPAPTAPRPR